LKSDVKQSLERQRAAEDQVLQRDAVEKLHGDEKAASFFANVVNGADIGMVERGRRTRFAQEAVT